MIEGHGRLIVVLGMAHSGTTILTYVLKQHPQTMLAIDGSEAWLLENTFLPLEQTEPIQQLLQTYPNRSLLLKRPWSGVHNADFMLREMPNAKFIYCYRDFNDIAASWSKPTSLINDQLRAASVEQKQEYYQMCLQKAEEFGRKVPFFKKVYHPHFVGEPSRVMAELSMWLGLTPFRFDVSEVSWHKDIKMLLCHA